MEKYDIETRLRLMRFWLVGAFGIMFAAVTISVAMISLSGIKIFTFPIYWIWMVVLAAFCFGAYYFYKWYISRE